MSQPLADTETLRRWRLVLGGGEADGLGFGLSSDDLKLDKTLGLLYDATGNKGKGSLSGSAPNVNRWLGDIREYFPTSVVQIMQKDAMERLNLKQLLLEPEVLETLEPDIHLLNTLIDLKHLIPAKTKDTARRVVQKVVDDLMKRLVAPTYSAISGSLSRHTLNMRPRHNEIDWHRTIRKNLKNYQHDLKTIIPEKLVGYGRKKRPNLKEVILCVDQSGSMATSVIYSSIFAAVMASVPALKTQMIVFDTAVVDLTKDLSDPVDLLFGVQLGGGTDINAALKYCQGLITKPQDTILILISDLYEGGDEREMLKRAEAIISSGVQFISLLALSDEGKPASDEQMALELRKMGAPVFACTPDAFPELMARAIGKQDLAAWGESLKTEKK